MVDIDIKSSDGALEEPKDAGPGEEGEVKRWLMELDLAAKQERDWHRNAKKAIERYRSERKVGSDDKEKDIWQYNILWSNIEVMRPALYGATPKSNVQRRFRDPDPIGGLAAEILERGLDYSIDASDFDGSMGNIILDYLLPSRAVARVRFDPTVEGSEDSEGNPIETLTFARTYIERVPWDRFRRGPGVSWDEVPWVAYEHQITKQESGEKFPGKPIDYDVTMDGVSDEAAAVEPSVFKRVRVWEIWDKSKAEVLWLAPSYKGGFLKREEDKLKLEGFFDCEKPLYAVESGTTLVPIVEYDMYHAQAKELDRITLRINKLIATLKQRGIYDSTIKEFGELFSAADNEMVPTTGANMAMQAGGMDKAIWLMPLETVAKVLQGLYTQREQIKKTIYELTGISDILRGSTDANETLGAQQLKAQTGSMRLQRRQRDVQRFIRGLLRKMAEIIAQNYTPDILTKMTGIQLPTDADKQMAQMQMQAQQAQYQQMVAQHQGITGATWPNGIQPPPQPDPQTQQLLASPSWEDVMKVLKNDLLRSYRIDIETDSTIAVDQASERQQVTDLITGIGGFMNDIGPAVEQGVISMDAAKKILEACLRRFKLGREVEDVLEHDNGQPPPKKPDPEMAKAQAQMQLEQSKLQGQTQLEHTKLQNQIQLEQAKAQIAAQQDQVRAQADAQLAQAQQQAQAQQDSQQQALEAQRRDQAMRLQHETDVKKMLLDHKLDVEQAQAQGEARIREIVAKAHADLMVKHAETGMKVTSDAIARHQDHNNEIEKVTVAAGLKPTDNEQ